MGNLFSAPELVCQCHNCQHACGNNQQEDQAVQNFDFQQSNRQFMPSERRIKFAQHADVQMYDANDPPIMVSLQRNRLGSTVPTKRAQRVLRRSRRSRVGSGRSGVVKKTISKPKKKRKPTMKKNNTPKRKSSKK